MDRLLQANHLRQVKIQISINSIVQESKMLVSLSRSALHRTNAVLVPSRAAIEYTMGAIEYSRKLIEQSKVLEDRMARVLIPKQSYGRDELRS